MQKQQVLTNSESLSNLPSRYSVWIISGTSGFSESPPSPSHSWDSSLCVNPSVSNRLPIRLTETSTFICLTRYLISSRGCLPLSLSHKHSPSSTFTLPASFYWSVLCFTHSSPLASVLSCFFDQVLLLSHTLPTVLLAERTVQRPGSSPPSLPRRKNKQAATCSQGILMTSITLASLPAKPQAAWGNRWTLDEPLMTSLVNLSQVVSFKELSSFKRSQSLIKREVI